MKGMEGGGAGPSEKKVWGPDPVTWSGTRIWGLEFRIRVHAPFICGDRDSPIGLDTCLGKGPRGGVSSIAWSFCDVYLSGRVIRGGGADVVWEESAMQSYASPCSAPSPSSF